MKRFSFTLQAVLTLRKRAEQSALELYSRLLVSREAARKKLDEVDEELVAAWKVWRAQLTAGCPAGEAAQSQAYSSLLEKQRTKCAESLRQAERELNAASESLISSRQEREVVEKLQSAQRKRHERELLIEERKEIEDLIRRRVPAVVASNLPGTWN